MRGLDAVRLALGLDTPFRVTDVTPPKAMSEVERLTDRLEEAERTIRKQRILLEEIVQPFSSQVVESHLRNAIRRHLRESRHV